MRYFLRSVTIATFFIIESSVLQAQDCGAVAAIAEMARAKSTHTLSQASNRAGESYLARLVFAYRSFQLNPGRKIGAERLLGLIPTNDIQQESIMTLGDSLCDQESIADMKTLDRVGGGIAREFTKGVKTSTGILPIQSC